MYQKYSHFVGPSTHKLKQNQNSITLSNTRMSQMIVTLEYLLY